MNDFSKIYAINFVFYLNSLWRALNLKINHLSTSAAPECNCSWCKSHKFATKRFFLNFLINFVTIVRFIWEHFSPFWILPWMHLIWSTYLFYWTFLIYIQEIYSLKLNLFFGCYCVSRFSNLKNKIMSKASNEFRLTCHDVG